MPRYSEGRPIYNFLTTNHLIKRIRFQFGKFEITPTVFEKIADLFVPKHSAWPEILLKGKVSKGAFATYDMAYDTLALPPGFDLTDLHHQSQLVHECTHIYLDNLNMGSFSNYLNEAVGYTAEGVFGTLAGLPPASYKKDLSNQNIFTTSYNLGNEIVNKGMVVVDQTWQDAMIKAVKDSTHYGLLNKPPETISNKRNRGFFNELFRGR